MGVGDYNRVFSAVTAMAYEPGGHYGLIHEILDEVWDKNEGLVHAVWIAGEACRQWASATGQPLQALLAHLAPDDPDD